MEVATMETSRDNLGRRIEEERRAWEAETQELSKSEEWEAKALERRMRQVVEMSCRGESVWEPPLR